MKATEQLEGEHKGIKLMLEILEKVCSKLESGQQVNPEHLEQIIEFIRVFADKCHHAKEEDLLFPEMERAGVPKKGGPIDAMLTQHKLGRGYVKGMQEAMAKYIKGERQASSKFIEDARNYISLLSLHIDKEDNVLYPMADGRLSEEKQKELVEEFEKIELERIGPGRHEKFHRLLNHFKEIYLEKGGNQHEK